MVFAYKSKFLSNTIKCYLFFVGRINAGYLFSEVTTEDK